MTSQRTGPVELLAPAGGPDALRAAVNNGADAVYLGLRGLNARRGAENFDLPALEQACRYAQIRGRRVYLTANILVSDREMEDALRDVASAAEAGVDAVIVQDLGLMTVLRESLPDLRIHASTQVDVHDPSSARVLEELGAARVTLAREVSLEEVARIADAASCEVEAFVHGALCFSYSGQCLLSSVVGGRSANRGLCAQPCRLAYELLDASGREVVTEGAHVLSPKDLAGLPLLPELVRAGVAALKIEGRMKSPEYVAVVTGVYRAALDRALADPDAFKPLPREWEMLEEVFSRGFTTGHLGCERGDDLMGRHRPNNRGVLVGRLTALRGDRAELALERSVESDDTVEVWTSSGRFAQRLGPLGTSEGERTVACAGSKVLVTLERRAAAGDRVFRVASGALLAAARRSLAADAPGAGVAVDAGVRLRVGSPLVVRLTARGVTHAATGPDVEAARTKALTAQEVVEHVGRMGGTPFEAASWEIDLDPSAGISFSTLHAVRRAATDGLADALSPVRRVSPTPLRKPAVARERDRPAGLELVATAWTPQVARAALEAGADRVLIREGSCEGCEPLLPRVADDCEAAGELARARDAGRATAGHLGLLARASGEGIGCDADHPLNAFNAWAVERLAGLGARFVWLSPELSGRGVAEVAARAVVPVGVAVYGRLEVMVSRECVLRAAGPCDGRCAGCARHAAPWALRDRKGYAFPLLTDRSGRSRIFNSVRLDLTRALPEIVGSGVAAVRLEFTVEDPAEAAAVTARFRAALDSALAGCGVDPLEGPTTTGHHFRGVR